MVGGRRLIIDADLNKRLASELKKRGRAAIATSELSLAQLKDPPLLAKLAKLPYDIVLVTGDDRMPAEHGTAIALFGMTIATVDPLWEGRGYQTVDEYRRDVVHRWAHRMAEQPPGSVRRYSPNRGGPWTQRK